MPAVFLTTPALEIFLLWRESWISKFLRSLSANEVWISPLSHAILEDTFTVQAGHSTVARRGINAVERHRRKMATAGKATYPRPTDEAIRIWAKIRSLEVNIPTYVDGPAKSESQIVGPDELLVFATAAAHSLPLFGPQPTDSDTLDFLTDLGITFHSLDGLGIIPLTDAPNEIKPDDALDLSGMSSGLSDMRLLDLIEPPKPGDPQTQGPRDPNQPR